MRLRHEPQGDNLTFMLIVSASLVLFSLDIIKCWYARVSKFYNVPICKTPSPGLENFESQINYRTYKYHTIICWLQIPFVKFGTDGWSMPQGALKDSILKTQVMQCERIEFELENLQVHWMTPNYTNWVRNGCGMAEVKITSYSVYI